MIKMFSIDRSINKILGKSKALSKRSVPHTKQVRQMSALARSSIFFPFTQPTVKHPVTGRVIRGRMPNMKRVMGNFGLKQFGGKNDWDGDGVPNKKDCEPRNIMRQHGLWFGERGRIGRFQDDTVIRRTAPGISKLKVRNKPYKNLMADDDKDGVANIMDCEVDNPKRHGGEAFDYYLWQRGVRTSPYAGKKEKKQIRRLFEKRPELISKAVVAIGEKKEARPLIKTTKGTGTYYPVETVEEMRILKTVPSGKTSYLDVIDIPERRRKVKGRALTPESTLAHELSHREDYYELPEEQFEEEEARLIKIGRGKRITQKEYEQLPWEKRAIVAEEVPRERDIQVPEEQRTRAFRQTIGASEQKQREWQDKSETEKDINRMTKPDVDKDLVPDEYDCEPDNPDKQGFIHNGIAYVYHGTSAEKYNQIKSQGLRPSPNYWGGPSVFLTPSKKTAKKYAKGNGIVLQVAIPRHELQDSDTAILNEKHPFYQIKYSKFIPPSSIKVINGTSAVKIKDVKKVSTAKIRVANGASIAKQQEWKKLSLKRKILMRKTYRDTDRDGVPDKYDCEPNNPEEQHGLWFGERGKIGRFQDDTVIRRTAPGIPKSRLINKPYKNLMVDDKQDSYVDKLDFEKMNITKGFGKSFAYHEGD